MPGYVQEALLKFQHHYEESRHSSPSPHVPIQYGQKMQMANIDDSDPLTKTQVKLLQQVCGQFLYYARAVDATMLHALNDLATKVNNGTQETAKALTHFLNYCAANPDASIKYHASDMILHNHSDAAYLVASNARSRAGGYTYFGNEQGKEQIFNPPIAVIAKVIKAVMSSASEAEIGALYMNAQELIPLRVTCEELGHPQPATPMRTDNTTACGLLNKKYKQNRSKANDMRFWWLVDRADQNQFQIYWDKSETNLADYFTKHHPGSHHRQVRPIYTQQQDTPRHLQGCIELLKRKAAARPARSS